MSKNHQPSSTTQDDTPLTQTEIAQALTQAKKDKRAAQAILNGSKSHGPTTPEGKAISSKNSLTHGHAAQINVLIQHDDTEAWHAHLAGYYSSFHPTDYFESELVDELAAASWKKARLSTTLTTLMDFQLSIQEHRVNQNFSQEAGNPQLHLALAWQALARKPLPRDLPADPSKPIDPTIPPEQLDIDSIELVRRYMMLHDRQFRTALLNLRQYRKDFPAHQAQPEPAADAPQQIALPRAKAARPNEPTKITLIRAEMPEITSDSPTDAVPAAPEVAA